MFFCSSLEVFMSSCENVYLQIVVSVSRTSMSNLSLSLTDALELFSTDDSSVL